MAFATPWPLAVSVRYTPQIRPLWRSLRPCSRKKPACPVMRGPAKAPTRKLPSGTGRNWEAVLSGGHGRGSSGVLAKACGSRVSASRRRRANSAASGPSRRRMSTVRASYVAWRENLPGSTSRSAAAGCTCTRSEERCHVVHSAAPREDQGGRSAPSREVAHVSVRELT